MKKIALFLCAATLCSCSLYKQYQRGQVETSGLYGSPAADTSSADTSSADTSSAGASSADTSSADTSSIGNMSWRQMFPDPYLQLLIGRGLDNNTDLRIAKLKTEQAQATLQASRLAYLPSVGIEARGTVSSPNTKDYSIGASASWEIDIFGKLTAAKRASRSAVEQSEAYGQAVQTQLISTIAGSYYTLLMLDEQLSISEQTIVIWSENVATLRALKAAGQSSEAAVAQSEASLLSVEASTLTLRKEIRATENSLSTLIGLPVGTISRGRLCDQQFPSSLSIGIPIQMLSNRPDVLAAEAALAVSFYSTEQARASFYPSITLTGSGGWMGSGGAIANPASLVGSVIGSLLQPVFNRGRNIAQLKIARAQQKEAELNFTQSLLDAGAEVNNALTSWQTARGRIVIDERRIERLQSAVFSTSMMMQHGTTNYLEVLVARQTLLQSQLTTVNDRFDEIQGVITLYRSLGGGRF